MIRVKYLTIVMAFLLGCSAFAESASNICNQEDVEPSQALCSLPDRILDRLESGAHTGVTDSGVVCSVFVYDGEMTFMVQVSDEDFVFGEDRGSSACMYSKACFVYRDGHKVLSSEVSESSLYLRVKTPGGGPDLAAKKKMSLQIQAVSPGLTRVLATETVALFGLLSVSAHCNIKR